MDWVENELRDYLIDLYWKKEKSLTEIAKELDVPLSSVWDIFDEYFVPRRSIKKAMKLIWKQRKIAQESEQNLKEKLLKNNEDLLKTDKKQV